MANVTIKDLQEELAALKEIINDQAAQIEELKRSGSSLSIDAKGAPTKKAVAASFEVGGKKYVFVRPKIRINTPTGVGFFETEDVVKNKPELLEYIFKNYPSLYQAAK